MRTLGRHVVAEFYGCDPEAIDDLDRVGAAMRGAADEIGATVVSEAFHRYAPQGVTGTLLIAESHLSVHTWPESGYAAVDIFTCGDLRPREGLRVLLRAFGAKQCRVQEIVRGIDAEVAEASAALAEEDVIIFSTLSTLRGADDH